MKKMLVFIFIIMGLYVQLAQAGLKEGEEAFNIKDYDSALVELEPWAKEGNSKAALIMGKIYNQKKDYTIALSYFQKAADRGSSEAELYIAMAYGLGLINNNQSLSRALSSLDKTSIYISSEPQKKYIVETIEKLFKSLDILKRASDFVLPDEQKNNIVEIIEMAKNEDENAKLSLNKMVALLEAAAAEKASILAKAEVEEAAKEEARAKARAEERAKAEAEAAEIAAAAKVAAIEEAEAEARKSIFYQILLFAFLLITIGVFYAGTTNKVVIFFDLKDVLMTFLGLVLPLVSYVLIRSDVFFFNTLLGPLVGLIGVFLLLNSIFAAKLYNKCGWSLGLFIAFYRIVFSILFLFISASYIMKVLDKRTSLRDIIIFSIGFALFGWLAKGLVNGKDVYDINEWD